MELGLHDVQQGDEAAVSDLGVTWTKTGADLADETQIIACDDRRRLEWLRSLGLQLVIDIRINVPYLNARAIDIQMGMAERGELEEVLPTDTVAERHRKESANQKPASLAVAREVGAAAAAYVQRHGYLCSNWEFWGEYNCPWTSQGLFDNMLCYSTLLREVRHSIKAVQAEGRIWTGGNGMDWRMDWLRALVQEEAGDAFDILNLHPYFITIHRDRRTAAGIVRRNLEDLRRILREDCRDQPFAATEWGYPTLPRRSFRERIGRWVARDKSDTMLTSHVFCSDIRAIPAEEAVDWFEGDLSAFNAAGFEVVIVHALRDRPDAARHWGDYCGLLTASGKHKPVWDVVQRWAWRGRGAD